MDFCISPKPCVPGQNCLLLPCVLPGFAFIFSSHLTPIHGFLPFTPLGVLPCIDVTKGKPIVSHLQTVALVLTIFCDKKYLKSISLALLNWFGFCSNLICSLLVSISAFKPSLSPQIVCCEIVSLMIDISILLIFKLQCCRFSHCQKVMICMLKVLYIEIP